MEHIKFRVIQGVDILRGYLKKSERRRGVPEAINSTMETITIYTTTKSEELYDQFANFTI